MPQGWYGQVSANLGKIADCITFYESQLEEARVECGLVGNIEKNATRIPGIVEHRFNQLQEIEAILNYLNIELRRLRSTFFKKYLENYQNYLNYEIQKGDVLSEIAIRFGVTVDSINKTNNLENKSIFPGQIIRIEI